MGRFTLKDIEQSKVAGINKHISVKPKSKYGNKKVKFNDILFDSKKELSCYLELRKRLLAGEIENLRLQIPFDLNEGGKFSYKYFADFVYTEAGKEIVADAKGYRTKVYLKKRKLMKNIYGIDILEL